MRPLELLMVMKQSGTVLEYCRWFEKVVMLTSREREEVLKATFLNGLKPEIWAEIKLQQPNLLT